MNIQQRLIEVMKEVGAVGKNERNQIQNFNFRGIDAVINAVSPAFIKHGVIVAPFVEDSSYEIAEIGQKKTLMCVVRVKVSYTFYGADGDSLTVKVVAESMDSGDKATAKAMSVALRTALLQTLSLPTNEPDPDASTYERSSQEQEEPESNPKSESTPEQIHLAKEAVDQVPQISSIAELKMFFTGAKEANLLNIKIEGKTLNQAITERKAELENAK